MNSILRSNLVRLVKLTLTIGIAFLLIRRFSISWDSFFHRISDLRYLLATFLIPLTIIPCVSVNRWRLFLALIGINERFFVLWKINLVASFQGLVLPSTQGHDAIRMYHIGKRYPGNAGAASGSVIVERMFGVLVFCGVALAGLPLVLRYLETKAPVVVGIVGFAAAAIVGTSLVVNRRIHDLYAGWRPKNAMLQKIVGFLDSTHATLVDFPYRKVMLSSIVLILLFQLSTILSVYLLFRAYGIELPFYMHMALYPVIAIIAMMPITIGGFGVREGAFAYFYSLVGVPAEVSVCVSIANYVVLSLVPAALGGCIWLWESIVGKR